MDILPLAATIIFAFGYLLITLEHKFNTNKSAIALAVSAILWVIASFYLHSADELSHALHEAGAEVFNILVFLLAAMTLVEILLHYRFFDLIRIKLFKLNLDDRKQFVIIGFLTFFLSALLDNLTVTIVMVQIAKRFFTGRNLLVVVSGVVIMANAGGAWSPIGDVTTIMIWLANKFDALQVIKEIFLPSLALGIIAMAMMVRNVKKDTRDVKEENIVLTKGEKVVVGVVLSTFLLPFIFSRFGLQPYMGLLFGLGVVWILIDFIKKRSSYQTHLNASIEQMLQKTDISSLKFFIGILLAVSALQAMGVLEMFSVLILGEHQSMARVISGNIVLGLASAVVDNVPLTAIALDMITISDHSVWTFLAYTVGTGGSSLLIGSVAGVIASGMVKELSFGKYLQIASLPAIVGYFGGILVWFLQREVARSFGHISVFGSGTFLAYLVLAIIVILLLTSYMAKKNYKFIKRQKSPHQR